MITLNIRHK